MYTLATQTSFCTYTDIYREKHNTGIRIFLRSGRIINLSCVCGYVMLFGCVCVCVSLVVLMLAGLAQKELYIFRWKKIYIKIERRM